MKVLQIFVLIILVCCFCFSGKAQSCGYSFVTVFVKDESGKSIKNAKIELLNKDREKENHLKSRMTRIGWLEEKDAYFISHGMCSEHFGVTLKISAEGYEPLEQNIDLPFYSQGFLVKLKRKTTSEQASFELLAHLNGKTTDSNDAAIGNAKVILAGSDGRVFETVANEYGYYDIDIQSGKYKIEFIGTNGFAPSKYENLQLKKGQNYLDAVLQVDTKCNCLVTEMICKPSEYDKEILNCNLVTKNPAKENQK